MTTESHKPRPLGGPLSVEVVQADLERYRQRALDLGASDAAIVPADWISVDERVRLKCQVPRCLRAGETPNCPPHAPDLDLVRRSLSRFSWAILVKCEVGPLEAYAPSAAQTKEDRKRTMAFHKASGQIVSDLEVEAYGDGYHLAMGFGGGSCKDYLCQGVICQVLDSGRCRFPHRARPAMEGVGIDVVDLVNKVGWTIYPLVGNLSTIPCAVTVGLLLIC